MRYKVGDKVLIKSIDWYNKCKANAYRDLGDKIVCGGLFFLNSMYKYCGQVLTIRCVKENSYYVKECPQLFNDEMIERLATKWDICGASAGARRSSMDCSNIKTNKEMETKEFKVSVPNGMEIDKENSTFECIKFKPKVITYDDIVRSICPSQYCVIFAPSTKQLEKVLAINRLINVAKYLNGGWKPYWQNNQEKYYIKLDEENQLCISSAQYENEGHIYFESKEKADKAIEILGEDIIRLALTTDYY